MKPSVTAAFLPNRTVNPAIATAMAVVWVAMGVVLWLLSPAASLPTPIEVARALGELWAHAGLAQELFTTLRLILHSLLWTVAIAMVLSYATVIPAARPLVAAASKLRFLGITGLVVPFTLATGGGYDLKVALLTFGMTAYFVTAMAQVVLEIPREQFDHMRALGASELRILWEVVIRGTFDKALDVLRQNLAIGWTMITMVEGISRAEGGLGAVILNENKHFKLAEVYAIMVLILIVGLLLDYLMGLASRLLCPYAELDRVRR
jgi:NitT/TauT family transport system permease protein